MNENYQRSRAEEVRRLEQERLDAIRARERGEDRAFQRETLQMQQSAQNERDQRTLSAQAERDARQDAARLKEIEAQGRNQLAYANAARGPDRPERVLMDINGKVVSLSMDDPRLSEGVEGTILQGSSGARFQPRTDNPRATTQGGSTPAPTRSAPPASTDTAGEVTVTPPVVRGDDSKAPPPDGTIIADAQGKQYVVRGGVPVPL
jgi:hypothetical protein